MAKLSAIIGVATKRASARLAAAIAIAAAATG
jgi:hypothetical protein